MQIIAKASFKVLRFHIAFVFIFYNPTLTIFALNKKLLNNSLVFDTHANNNQSTLYSGLALSVSPFRS